MTPMELMSHGESRVLPLATLNFDLPTLPEQGAEVLDMFRSHVSNDEECNQVVCLQSLRIPGNLELKRTTSSASWDGICALFCDGDLTIEGDLVNDDYNSLPLLIVRGDLTLRSWLRGGMLAFIGGSVCASGCLVGEYDDGGLFVGGNLIAAGGYIHRRKPYPDMPGVQPHQIRGQIQARTFDGTNPEISDEMLRSTFDPAVLKDFDGLWYDSYAIIERCAQGLPVWRNQ